MDMVTVTTIAELVSQISQSYIPTVYKAVQKLCALLFIHWRGLYIHGQGFISICNAISILANQFLDTGFVYPVHMNSNVQKPVSELLSGRKNIH